MCGYGAGETGGNRSCGGSQLRRCGSTEGSQPFVPGCRGAERPVDVRLAPTGAERRPAAHCWGQGVRVASGDLCGKAAKAPTEATAETNAHWAGTGRQRLCGV